MPRQVVPVRMSDAGVARLEEIMDMTGANRSDVVRVLMSEALASGTIRNKAVDRLKSMQDIV